jgi:uncharacterized RDD family membrane protein YckC
MDADGALQFSHSGGRYLLGFGLDFFGIWDRQEPGHPVERFPRTDEGWRAAWIRYTAIEPRWAEVAVPGPGAPAPIGPAGLGATGEPRRFALAPAWRRLAARVVDGLILAAIFTALVATGVMDVDVSSVDRIPQTFFAMAVIVGGIYETAFIASRGQTPGKMALRIKVVRAEAPVPPGLGRAVVRWAVPAVASIVPLGPLVVYGWLVWDRRRQGLHDKAARTLVISGT